MIICELPDGGLRTPIGPHSDRKKSPDASADFVFNIQASDGTVVVSVSAG